MSESPTQAATPTVSGVLVGRLKRVVAVAGLGAALIGSVALLGWILGIDLMKSVVPGVVTMKANTAVCFIATGAAIFLFEHRPDSRTARLAALGGAGFALVLSGLVTSQYVHGADLGVDLLLFHEPEGTVGTAHPGRMAVITGICFLLASAGILLVVVARLPGLSMVLGIFVASASSIALMGYLTGVTSLYGISGLTQMAIPTASAFMLLGAALACGQPTSGPMKLIVSDGAGGALARRLIPLTVGGVLVVVTLRLLGQGLGYYGTVVGAWLFAIAVVGFVVPMIWAVSWSLERADAERRAAARELRELAERDPLTGVFNRRRFDEDLGRQVALARRHGSPFAVLVIDLDRFKETNDTLGHQAGDLLLVAVAKALLDGLRGTDIVARFGGDEFVVLMPQTSLEGAEAAAAKAGEAIASISEPTSITASIGGVGSEGAAPAWLTADTMLSKADAELYRAKREGKNRVRVSAIAAATERL